MPSRPTRPIIDRSLSLRWGDLSEKERDLVRTERGWMDRGENKTIRFDLIVLVCYIIFAREFENWGTSCSFLSLSYLTSDD